MQVHDPAHTLSSTPLSDQPAMNGTVSPPIEPETAPSNGEAGHEADKAEEAKINCDLSVRKERPTRACTVRAKRYVEPPIIQLRSRPSKKRKVAAPVEEEEELEEEVVSEEEEEGGGEDREKVGHCGKIVTSLLNPPVPEQMPRWNLRAMWELASVLNFINVFRPLLKITAEFSAEELETALITPNDALSYVHIPLLKAIPPVTRMACGRETWVTVLCRKLRDWWHWVAEGDLPIVAAQGAEVEAYKSLDPAVRVLILKALCDIRVEQEDIRNYIDDCMKQGLQLSMFRKERIGGDSHGISYWYEDDAIIGHRLYREIRKVEAKKAKIKGSNVLPSTTFEWETVATNLDEFVDVSEKLFSSNNRTEASVGKKLKNIYLPEIDRIHKKKEKLLRKQQREALLLDSYVNIDGLTGRSLRDRKPVTYTFDDFDRSISDAIKITKRKLPSPEPGVKRELREVHGRSEPSTNGTLSESTNAPEQVFFSPPSPPDYDEMDEEDDASQQQLDLDRSSRRRQRPQRYSEREFVGEASYHVRDSDSDDEIVGEAVYDDDYIREKKRKKASSGSEGDEEYHWSDENGEEEEEEEEEEEYSMSEDSDGPRKPKKLPGRTRKETKLRSVGNLQHGLRRSNRATRNRINYQQYEQSESDHDSAKKDQPNVYKGHSPGSDNEEYAIDGADFDANGDDGSDQPPDVEVYPVKANEEQQQHQAPSGELNSANQQAGEVGKPRFLDLNEAAPGSGFEDGPSALMKDAGTSDS